MSKASRIAMVGLVGAAAVALTITGTTSAMADPAAGAARSVVAVGSNTTQDLDNGISNGFKFNGATYTATGSLHQIASYNALEPTTDAFGTTITAHPGSTPFGRPNGSGDGRKALSAAWNPANHVYNQTVNGVVTSYTLSNSDVTISRSSGKPGTVVAAGASNDNLTSIPEARDAIGVAMLNVNSKISNFSTAQLQALYGAGQYASGVYSQGSTPTVGDIVRGGATSEKIVTSVTNGKASYQSVFPILPQASSGTRSTFLSDLGTTNTVFGSWVQSDANQEENDIAALSASGYIEPFSGASLIAQERGLITDSGVQKAGVTYPTINGLKLWNGTKGTGAGLSGTASARLQGDPSVPVQSGVGVFARDVYTVVPTTELGTTVVTGTTEAYLASVKLPTAKDSKGNFVTADFGFEAITFAATQSSWLHSPFEN